jgi:hypothetical protein
MTGYPMMKPRLIPIRLIEPWRCTTPPGWREYAAMMRAGDEFPPVQVIRQSSKLHGYTIKPAGSRRRIFLWAPPYLVE